MTMQVLESGAASEWLEILGRVSGWDFYQLPSYHRLAEIRGEGQALLFVYQKTGIIVALPLLIRPLNSIAGSRQLSAGLNDATSVYGYSGPLANSNVPDEEMRHAFQEALRYRLQELGVITVFSRFHPLVATSAWLHGLGEIRDSGTTVSLDLTRPADEQWRLIRSNHRRQIKKLSLDGFESYCDTSLEHLDDFVSIYHDTMRHVGAQPSYFFNKAYFESLLSESKIGMQLFVTRHDGDVVSGGLFSLCRRIVQYHLGGTRGEYRRFAPMKHLFNTVRLWATDQGATVFHLGGGVGGRQDSLFEFKAGFSPVRHTFQTWRWVVDQAAYDQLVAAQDRWNQLHNTVCLDAEFFPRYRCPATPAEPS